MNKNWKKYAQRFFALFLCVAMLLPMFPQAVRASSTGTILSPGLVGYDYTTLVSDKTSGTPRFQLVQTDELTYGKEIALMSDKYGYIMSYDAISSLGYANGAKSLTLSSNGSLNSYYLYNEATQKNVFDFSKANGTEFVRMDQSNRHNVLWTLGQFASVNNNKQLTDGDALVNTVTDSVETNVKQSPHFGGEANGTFSGVTLVKGKYSVYEPYWYCTGAANEYRHLCFRSDSSPFKDDQGMEELAESDNTRKRYRFERFADDTFVIYYYAGANDYRFLYCDANGTWGVRRYLKSAADIKALAEFQELKIRLYECTNTNSNGTSLGTKQITIEGYSTYKLVAGTMSKQELLYALRDSIKVYDGDWNKLEIGTSANVYTGEVGRYLITQPSSSFSLNTVGTYTYTIGYRKDGNRVAGQGPANVTLMTINVQVVAKADTSAINGTVGILSKSAGMSDIVYIADSSNNATDTPVTFSMIAGAPVTVTHAMLYKNGAILDTSVPGYYEDVTVKYANKTIGTMDIVVYDGTIVQPVPSDKDFALGMKASANADDNSIIDVVISVKDIKQELNAIEFNLNFDKSLVAGVVTEAGDAMDAFMTVTPTYTMKWNGTTGPATRYEQACTYDASKGVYECRFMDLMSYPNAVAGQTYSGLINDGDLVITIQFKLLNGVSADKINFSATNVKGTTRDGLNSVAGAGTSIVYTTSTGGSSTEQPSGNYFALDMKATANADDSSVIDVVISVKDIKQELNAIEFNLNFDKSLVAGVVTEAGDAMDAFMTVTPTYTMKWNGTTGPATRYEQACKYDATKGVYECRFMDLMSYPNAVAGQTYKGLINDGDLVITIQFKLLNGVSADKINFSVTNVKGTTRDGLNSVAGTGSSVVYTISTGGSSTEQPSGNYFALDMKATANADDSSVIDVVISVKDIKQELNAIEFNLNFDKSLVAGVITEAGDAMDAFMTVTPTYTMKWNGMTGPATRYEQACKYDATKGVYECRFMDLMSYPNAVAGQTYKGLINDGDLVITIQFKLLSGVSADKINFSATNVKGTTRDGLNSISGVDASAVYTVASAEVDTMRIYFQNNWLWNDVRLYYWGSSTGENPAWRGYAMEYYEFDGTYDVYVLEVPTDITGIVINGIKNDGSNTVDQSPNIESGWYDGICYYMTWENGNQVGSASIDNIIGGSEDEIIPEDAHFVLDMSANVNSTDSSIIDVVVTIKDIKQELNAIEFNLNFDKSLVAGVITEAGDAMDAFMTVAPTYTMKWNGMTGPAPRYEQACRYDAANGVYECRFMDLMSYPNAVAGQTYKGLINDGDLVITIQFKLLNGVSAGKKVNFSASNVKATTRDGLNSVEGYGLSATYTVGAAVTNPEITKNVWTVSLDGVVYLNYYVNMSGFPVSYDFANKGGVVLWTGSSAPTSKDQLQVGLTNCKVVPGMFYSEDYGWGVKTDEIYAKNLGDLVYLRAYVQLSNGEYVYSPAAYYSPELYCRDKLSNTSERYDTRRVCAALLEYGASAQTYFGYKTNDLVNSGLNLSAYDLEFNASYLDAVDKPTSSMANTLTGKKTGISYYDATLDLQGAIRMNVGYTIDTNVIKWANVASAEVLFWNEADYNSASSLAYALDNYTSSCKLELGYLGDTQCYVAQSHHIFAQDLSDSLYYSCRIVMKDGTVYRSGLGYYSPEQFVADHLNDSNLGQVDDVCEKIAVYSEMARQRFLENE